MRERENILVAEMSDGVYRCVCFGSSVEMAFDLL